MKDGLAVERVDRFGETGPFALDDSVGRMTVRHFDPVETVRFVDLNNSTNGLDGGAFRHGYFKSSSHCLELFQFADKPGVGGLNTLDTLDNRLAFGKKSGNRKGHSNAVIS